MSNAKDIMDHFISRAKNLQEFTVCVDVPDDFKFNGTVPFDMNIVNNEIEAKVWAVDFEEAVNRLDEWIETCK
jgi:hypothetical protein